MINHKISQKLNNYGLFQKLIDFHHMVKNRIVKIYVMILIRKYINLKDLVHLDMERNMILLKNWQKIQVQINMTHKI